MAKTIKERYYELPEEERKDFLNDPANRSELEAAGMLKKVAPASSKDAVGNNLVTVAGSMEPVPEDQLADYEADPANTRNPKYSDEPYTPKKTSTGAAASAPAYTESPEVAAAREKLAKLTAPGPFSSEWSEKLQAAVKEIENREKFSYDPYADTMFQRYKESYERGGKKAMEDTIGKAAAQTGGYSNSYAQAAGQGAYNEYMAALADKIPELEAAALARYNAENADMYSKAQLLSSMEQSDYAKYRDAMSDYQNERNFAYQQEMNDRQFDYQKQRDAVSDAQYAEQLAYKQQQDAIANDLAERKFAYQKETDAAADETDRRNKAISLGLSPDATWEEISAAVAAGVAATSGTETAETETKHATYSTVQQVVNDFENIYQDDENNANKALTWLEGLVEAGTISMTQFMSIISRYDLDTKYEELHGGSGGADTTVQLTENDLSDILAQAKTEEDAFAKMFAAGATEKQIRAFARSRDLLDKYLAWREKNSNITVNGRNANESLMVR